MEETFEGELKRGRDETSSSRKAHEAERELTEPRQLSSLLVI